MTDAASEEALFIDLIDRGGGARAHTTFQVETARTIARLMYSCMRTGDPDAVRDAAKTIVQLIPLLPQPKGTLPKPPTMDPTMSVSECQKIYSKLVQSAADYDWGDDVEPLSEPQRALIAARVELMKSRGVEVTQTQINAMVFAVASALDDDEACDQLDGYASAVEAEAVPRPAPQTAAHACRRRGITASVPAIGGRVGCGMGGGRCPGRSGQTRDTARSAAGLEGATGNDVAGSSRRERGTPAQD